MEISGFLELSYQELHERNLFLKKEFEKRKANDHYKEFAYQTLKREKKIKAVTVLFSDIEGKLLMLDFNKDYILDHENNLTFDGSSIRGFSKQNKSDLFLRVDRSSLRRAPHTIFGVGKVLVFTNIYDKDNKLYNSDFRGQIKQLSEKIYKEKGLIVNIAPEIEGMLFHDINAEQKFNEIYGFKLVSGGGYFNCLPQDELRKFTDKVAEIQRALGFENEKDHAEVAPSQFELNYKYSDILYAADQAQLYKLICRQVAKSIGYTASFLPKPQTNINGNGMHINISIMKNKKNLFYDESNPETISDYARMFLENILDKSKDLCLILNSSVNSYRRLDPHFEAPNEIKVSSSDRGSMIRIPLGNERSKRIEIRSVSPDSNPYLVMYSLLKTGLNGINKNQNLATKTLDNTDNHFLPGNIYKSLFYFESSEFIERLIGVENKNKYATIKRIAADRCPKVLGSSIKIGEIIYHHEITNQSLWNGF